MTFLPDSQQARPLQSSPLFAAPTLGRRLAIVGATLLMALCAHIAFPLSFTPVPTTMQTFGVLLLGMTLGPVAGAASMVLYLLEGAAGLPVFAPSGLPGAAHLLGPTAGFLFAYPIAAAAAGLTLRALDRRIGTFAAAILAGVAGLLPIFGFGAAWLATAPLPAAHHIMQLAVLPFLPGEAAKLLLVAGTVAALHRLRPTS